ncbi:MULTISPECIES: SDR family NAD(P)-dependent oxidoreductase [unclassified Crossiella]|uniref:SDR family NAD(P)-dependent oxidoreductase n=1 Tax=unclassified Crossiella TaxID=2620835 RepID=UPI001FFF3DD1|nr:MULTISPECIES: SDR family oxidoreductase [unclassified Crossiella]MCK2239560.1 SDR family oxidoreductase [Crossiella sp. S99.2]MCK2252255.1 SDR family oxidoreductase [Crossiella sp. S99.1]
MKIDLTGRTALVTGSTSGIGYAVAAGFAQAGAAVVVNGRSADRVEQAVAKLKAETGSDTITGVAADIATAEGAEGLFDRLPDVDILINNTGIFEPKPVFEITDADWLRFFEVNVLSGVRLSRHYAPRMAARGWGRVIFVSSESAVMIPREMVHYGMTKTAQLSVARGLALEVADTGVTVNSVLPGSTLTEGVRTFIGELYPDLPFEQAEREFMATDRPTSLLKRLIRPEEIANLIVYTASEGASATTGAALRVDGGLIPTI